MQKNRISARGTAVVMPYLATWVFFPLLGLAGQVTDDFGPVSMGTSVFDSGWNTYGTKPVAGFATDAPAKIDQAPLASGPAWFPGGGRWWMESEFVMAWIRGADAPPLLTAGPFGQANNPQAAVGAPGTTILAGGNLVNDGMRPGLRLGTGYWFNDEHTIGVQGSFLMIGTRAETVSAGGTTTDTPLIISQPFVVQANGNQSGAPINFPGVLRGGSVVSSKGGYLYGASADARANLSNWFGPEGSATPDRSFRVDGTLGYQFIHYSDGVGIMDSSVVLPGGAFFGADALRSMESFTASNMYNGGAAGLSADWWSGRWHLVTAGKIGFGGLYRQAGITGETVITSRGTQVNVPGAVLARPTNIGEYWACSLAWVPQADFKVDYRVTERIILSAGYTVLVLPEVWRAAEQIDPVLGLGQSAATSRPVFQDHRSTLWMQGITLGLRLDF